MKPSWNLLTKIALSLVVTALYSIHAFAMSTEEPLQEDTVTTEETLESIDPAAAYQAYAMQLWASMKPQSGEISLPNGVATLNVPENFYYLSPEDTKKVLEDLWGNPPSNEQSLGMLFPSEMKPFDRDSWGVTIDYVQEGFVADEGAEDIDYADMLKSMQKDTQDANTIRLEQGYEAIELVGWASAPFYDKSSKKLHWAKELKFGDQQVNTLNYNIRVLGRRGYLLLNFIASMDQLDSIQNNVPTVLEIAEFDTGHRYADFDPDVDDVAAYGLGALVAGKVLAKTGILATVLLLLKKFWVVIFIAIGGLWKMVTKRGS